MPKKLASKSASKSPDPAPRSRSATRGRSPTPKRTLNSVPTPDRYVNAVGMEGMRRRRAGAFSVGGPPETASAALWSSKRAGWGWRSMLKCLWDPSAAKDIPVNSVALRALEAVSLLINLMAFYMIVSLNKKLFKSRDKGGYGVTGVATLTFFQYITSWFMLRLSGVRAKPFERDEWKTRVTLHAASHHLSACLSVRPSTYLLYI